MYISNCFVDRMITKIYLVLHAFAGKLLCKEMIFTHICEISIVDLGISLLSECCAMFMASKAEPDCHWVW